MKVISLLLFLLTTTVSFGQDFSKEWLGEWQGQLKIHNAEGLQQEILMRLNIEATSDSTWAWQIIYGEGETQDLRDYELQRGQGQQYVLDEKNTIVLYLSYINNSFHSSFELMGTQLLISYEMGQNEIIFRTVSSSKQEPLKSGGTSDQIPEVRARKVTNTQVARLRKK